MWGSFDEKNYIFIDQYWNPELSSDSFTFEDSLKDAYNDNPGWFSTAILSPSLKVEKRYAVKLEIRNELGGPRDNLQIKIGITKH